MPDASRHLSERLQVLYQISLQLSSTLNLDDVLGKVLSLTVSAIDASKGSIFLLDPNGRVVRRILARAQLPPKDSSQVVARVMDTGLAGWVFRHRSPAMIADTRQDERWVAFPDDITMPRSALAVPLLRGLRVVGLLTLVHPDRGHFTEDDLELTVAIGGLAAVAVENARLFTQVNADRRTLAAVLRNVRAAILVTDPQQTILLINPPAALILNTSSEAAVGSLLESVVGNESLLALFGRASAEMDAPISGEVRIDDGSTFNATISPVPGVGFAAVLHDITFLKRLDELKTESLAAVSHDLRGPLGVILGSAEMMVHYTDIGEEQKEFIDLITSTADRMRGLVERLLDLSRIESGHEMAWEMLAVPDVLVDILPEIRAQAQLKQIQLVIQPDDELPLIRADRVRLGQAVANLLHNAVKYTPPKGKVVLTASLDTNRRGVLINVQDTGPGIPPEARQKLFQKFFRVSSVQTMEVEGAGLGLAIVRSVAEAHHGRVWVESEWGHGATFIIALPLEPPVESDAD